MCKIEFAINNVDPFDICHLLDDNGYPHKYALMQNAVYSDIDGTIAVPATKVWIICKNEDSETIKELVNNFLASKTTEAENTAQ